MAAPRTCWDPPYRSRHQQLGQQRQPWDLPRQRQSRGVQPYVSQISHRTLMSHRPPPPHRMGSVQPRSPTCWDPPSNRPLPSFQPYDPPQSQRPSRWEPSPHRASQGYSDYDQPPPRRPSCWDPPRQRTDHCYRPLQPQHQSRSATKADRLLEALDRALDRMETRIDAIDRRVSKIRSSPQQDRDQPDVSLYLRDIEYSPLRNTIASFGPSGLPHNDSSYPPRHRTKADQPVAHQPSCWEPPLTATTATDQVHQTYQPPPLPPLLRLNCQPQQPSPAPPVELLLNSAPGPTQPVHPPPVTTLFLAPSRRSQAVVLSPRKKEWPTKLQDDDECGLINEVVPCLHDLVWGESIIEDKRIENEIGPKGLVGCKDGEDSDIFKMSRIIIVRAFDPGICVGFSKRKCDFLAMTREKTDLHDSGKELPHEEVITCLFATEAFRIELHIPAKPVVCTHVRKFNGDDDGGRTTISWVFDPGGVALLKLLLSTLVNGSWFPP